MKFVTHTSKFATIPHIHDHSETLSCVCMRACVHVCVCIFVYMCGCLKMLSVFVCGGSFLKWMCVCVCVCLCARERKE